MCVVPVSDMEQGCVGDMATLGITESYQVKRQVLLSAAEAAEMILRVDDIIKSAPRYGTVSYNCLCYCLTCQHMHHARNHDSRLISHSRLAFPRSSVSICKSSHICNGELLCGGSYKIDL